jgi:predicted HicB family RNase H-like nuclease
LEGGIMAINLDDTQVEKLADFIAKYFTSQFYKDELNVYEFIKLFDEKIKLFKGQVFEKAKTHWQDIEKDLAEFKRREMDHSLKLFLAYQKNTTEEKLKAFLPEEKLIFNQQIFQSLLKQVQFDKLTPTLEKELLNKLRTESIGLSDQEVFIYYNLIKYSRTQLQATEATASQTDSFENIASLSLEKLQENFDTVDSLAEVNEHRKINYSECSTALMTRLKTKSISTQVSLLYSGAFSSNQKFPQLVKRFITLVCDKWGTDSKEALRYVMILFLFTNLEEKQLESHGLSIKLINLLRGEMNKIKPIIQVSVQFIYLFSIVLCTQVCEINKKYQQVSPEQKKKLIKLYSASERRAMIVNNAGGFAFQKIAHHRSEASECSKNFKAFTSKFPNLLTVEDMFHFDYTKVPE